MPLRMEFQRVLITEDGIEIYRETLLSGTVLYTKILDPSPQRSIMRTSIQINNSGI